MVRVLLALDDDIPQAHAQTNAIEDMVETASGAEVYILHVFSDNPEGASVQQVEAVREAAEMILDGAPHGAVYSFLERKRNELKHKGMEYHQFHG